VGVSGMFSVPRKMKFLLMVEFVIAIDVTQYI